jgi:glycosyltransferase involved in cell wall biosynthesis
LSFFRKHDVSLVLAEFGPTGAALRTICKSAGIPLVVNFHGYDATVMPKRPDICAAYRLLARDVAGVLCGSRHFRDTVASIGFSKDQITVIPCGVNTEQFSANPARSGRRLVAVGRLTPKKAPLVTLKAFQKARQSFPDLTLTVIGDGPLMPDCRAFVAESCLSGCVILHGATSHAFVQETLSDADIFIQHSITAPNGDTESQGISLIEAMASHLPVVTTDHNGFSETVLDGQTGFLVPEGDEDAMAERIVRLLKDIQMRKTFGEAGYVRAKTFFDDRIVTQRLRDYLKTISSF